MNLIYFYYQSERKKIMSRTRRNFTAQFKAKLVLEVLKGEKDINTIATENNIQPNLRFLLLRSLPALTEQVFITKELLFLMKNLNVNES